MNKTLQTVGNISLQVGRILFGAVFVFSGFVKAIDPLGSSYKIEDYLHTFGGFFGSMADYAFPFAIALSTLELLIGLNMIFNIHIDLTNILALLFMLVMTPLTLYIAIKNPVSDCGCFGEALIISNWATFFKNAILISLLILMLIYHHKFQPFLINKLQFLAFFVFIAFGISLSLYSYRHLPMIDFLPYKVGVNIPKAMEIPDNAPSDEYKTTFIYQKDGVKKEFTLENYPKGDPSWTFVDQKSVLVSQGYKPPIHDFSIMNDQFDDITQEVLNYPGKTYLLTMYDLDETSIEGAKKAENIYQKALKDGDKFYALTASSNEDIKKFVAKTGVTFPFWKTDPTALKTVIRANPGLVLLKKGTILGKWNWRDFK
ncbi:MAG: DoxX family protein [Paludibacter sp.]|nr:DoxX family protein [Paludibacter sp.]